MEPAKDKTREFEIEKMADIRAAQQQVTEEITFDNQGNMVAKNRAYRRNLKRLWRAVQEERRSIHYYTKARNKTNRRTKKLERQNRRKGRLANGCAS